MAKKSGNGNKPRSNGGGNGRTVVDRTPDLAAKEPLKLKQLQDLFMADAGKYNVLPLDDRAAERLDPRFRPSLIEGRTEFTYYAGTNRVTESCAPNIKNRSHAITAHVEIPAAGGDGVLVAEGGVVARFSADETFDIGCDTGSPVSTDYKSPFRFAGKIKKVDIKLEEEKLTPAEHAEVQKMHAAAEAARH